ncbi:MAG: phosphomannomutase/phosphoglucomutase [Pseudomonadales bacterium]|nr:phosphomannomutase/phosphoglucomutase [Pseudomonadales bacterium]
MSGKHAPVPEPEPETDDLEAAREIFRAYDIRGVVGELLTPALAEKIGLAIGSEAQDQGEHTVIVGADGRLSSKELCLALVRGITGSGCDVIDLGMVPTPVLYFATQNSETRSGVMVTASHNPPEYNGFKIVIDGRTLVEEDIQGLYQRIADERFHSGEGRLREFDILSDYVDAIADDVVVAQPPKIVVDCGNGVAGLIAQEVFSNLGCDVVPLYCEVDGNFPNHLPDPLVPGNLDDLIALVKSEGADMGLALDGDGDRMVAVTSSGDVVWPDRLLMLFAKDVVSRNPGSDVVYDVKCTRHLNSVISSLGGRPIMCRSGHSYLKEKMKETDAVLGGEMSGHICFNERWFGFDDGLYAGARLIEIVGSQTEGLAELLSEFPESITTPEIIVPVSEKDKFRIIEELTADPDFAEGAVTTIDGLRIDYSDGWGLVRASNTSPALTLRFEADSEETLANIQHLFREKLQSIDSSIDF